MSFQPDITRLHPKFVRSSILWPLGSFVVGALICWLFGSVSWERFTKLRSDIRIWQIGVPAASARVSGKVQTNHYFFNKYKLVVVFWDAAGQERQGNYEFDTLGVTVPEDRPVAVRFLRDDSSQFALSWAVDMIGNRWLEIVVISGFGAFLVSVGCVMLPHKLLREYWDAKRCLRDFRITLLPVTKVVKQLVDGRHSNTFYSFAGETPAGVAFKGEVAIALGHEPLFANAAGQAIIALQSQVMPQRPVVLRDDCYPFQFSADDIARIKRIATSPLLGG